MEQAAAVNRTTAEWQEKKGPILQACLGYHSRHPRCKHQAREDAEALQIVNVSVKFVQALMIASPQLHRTMLSLSLKSCC